MLYFQQAGIEYEQRYYPETFHKIMIVRAPWLFSAVWNIVNPWLNGNAISTTTFQSRF
jgi:hypothetical protein